MSYIKIQKIRKEELDEQELIPEKGYIYLGYDDDTVDGERYGLWIKNDNGDKAYYILAQNDAKPVINSFFPVNYSNNGNTISIYGENFIPAQTNVTFGGVSGINVTVLSSIQLTVIVPNVSGIVEVVVSTGYGWSDPKNYTIVYINVDPVIIPPIIPSEAPIGASITINGYNFIVGDTITWFGGVSGVTTVLNSTLLTAVIPQTNTGQTIIFVDNVSANTQSNAVDYFITNTNVTFENFYPAVGYIGSTISISGSNFAYGQIQVRFGSTPATDINIINSNYITAKIATGTPFGQTVIRVHNISLSGFTVSGSTSGLLPTINSISPISAHTGQTLTVYGTNLGGTLTITFSNVPVTIVSNTTNQATVYLGADIVAGANSVYVINQYGKSISPYVYNVAPLNMGGPVIDSFTPSSEFRNRTVQMYGRNFISPGSNNITYFGNILSPQTQCTISTEYRAKISPYSPTGLVDIKIVNTNGSYTMTGFTINSDGAVYTYPTITHVEPTYAKEGDIIIVYGTNLDQADLSFGLSYPGFISNVTNINSNQLTTMVPSGLVTAGENKIFSIYATTLTGTCLYSPIEIYALPLVSPSITSFFPIAGSMGTFVTIYGSNFSKYWTDASVYISGTYYILDSQNFISNSEISGYIPNTNGNYGSSTIKVTTPIGVYQKSTFTITDEHGCDLDGIIDCYII